MEALAFPWLLVLCPWLCPHSPVQPSPGQSGDLWQGGDSEEFCLSCTFLQASGKNNKEAQLALRVEVGGRQWPLSFLLEPGSTHSLIPKSMASQEGTRIAAKSCHWHKSSKAKYFKKSIYFCLAHSLMTCYYSTAGYGSKEADHGLQSQTLAAVESTAV